jgi:hypothetical protein
MDNGRQQGEPRAGGDRLLLSFDVTVIAKQ